MRRENIWTHVLYDHRSRPSELDLSCPKCGAKISFRKESEAGWMLSGDTAGTWHLADWKGSCSSCITKFEHLAFEDLPDIYYKDERTGIWAYNLAHLQHMINYFSDREDDSPYSFYDTYFRKEWLQRKDVHLKALRRMEPNKSGEGTA